MYNQNESQLDWAVAMADQMIDLTIDFLVLHMHKPDQLGLVVTREQTLLKLQSLLHLEHQSANVDSERVWRLISAITSTALSYVLDTGDGETIQYKHRHECAKPLFQGTWHTHGSPSVNWFFTGESLWILGR